MKTSKKGIELIKQFEGFSPVPYLCPAGKMTIGYGHVIEANPFLKRVTREEAEAILWQEIKRVDKYLNRVIKVKLTQGQFDAICSLVFNWGFGNFSKSKGLANLNNKEYKKASVEFFSKSKGVVNIKGKFSRGLYRRRQAELGLWNGPK